MTDYNSQLEEFLSDLSMEEIEDMTEDEIEAAFLFYLSLDEDI